MSRGRPTTSTATEAVRYMDVDKRIAEVEREAKGESEAPPGRPEATYGPIYNRMQDFGDGRHVGWWIKNTSLGEQSVTVEVTSGSVRFACCEGAYAARSTNFVTDRGQAEQIVRAMAQALGLQVS